MTDEIKVNQADRDAANLAFNVWDNTNELALAFARHRQAAIKERDAQIERLREALREVFEEWAGSEGFIPETAPERYLLQLTKRMADTARAALKGSPQ